MCCDEVEAPELFALGDGGDGLEEEISIVGGERRTKACRGNTHNSHGDGTAARTAGVGSR